MKHKNEVVADAVVIKSIMTRSNTSSQPIDCDSNSLPSNSHSIHEDQIAMNNDVFYYLEARKIDIAHVLVNVITPNNEFEDIAIDCFMRIIQ